MSGETVYPAAQRLARVTAERDDLAQRLANLLEDHGRLTTELTELRAAFERAAEEVAPDQVAAERNGSAWWFAAWKVNNRHRAELAVLAEMRAAQVAALEAELAKERERTAGLLGAAPVPSSIALTPAEARLAWQGLGAWSSDDNDAPVAAIEWLRARLLSFVGAR